MNNIIEKDWKQLRKLKDEKLQIACEEIFSKINSIIEKNSQDSHKAYLKLWKVMKEEDRKISDMFDDLKRSNAVLKLAYWRRHGLLTENDLKKFTDETQNRIDVLNNI